MVNHGRKGTRKDRHQSSQCKSRCQSRLIFTEEQCLSCRGKCSIECIKQLGCGLGCKPWAVPAHTLHLFLWDSIQMSYFIFPIHIFLLSFRLSFPPRCLLSHLSCFTGFGEMSYKEGVWEQSTVACFTAICVCGPRGRASWPSPWGCAYIDKHAPTDTETCTRDLEDKCSINILYETFTEKHRCCFYN